MLDTCKNLQPVTEEQNKEVQLSILKYFDKFCRDNGIQYFLADGTLLGAIRHHGYIPWDDDIDVRVPRPQYNQLKTLFKEYSEGNHYALVTPDDDIAQHYMIKIYDTRTVKIEPYLSYKNGYLGIDIDVFPIEGSPDNIDEFYKWGKTLRGYNRAFVYKKRCFKRSIMSFTKDFIRGRAHARLCIGMSSKQIADKILEVSGKYRFGESNYMGFIGCGELFRVPSNCFSEAIDVEFEGAFFKAPIGYDGLLTAQYGDYMQLPPKEKQITHHANNIFWK